MLKKIILKKQSGGGFGLLSQSLLGQANQSLFQPSMQLKAPSTSSIASGLNTQLNDKGFQSRMAQGQKDYSKQMKSDQNKQNWGDFKSNISEFASSDLGKQSIDSVMSVASNIPEMMGKKSQDLISTGVNSLAPTLNALVPGLGYGVQALDILDRSLGSSVKGFNGNTGISGYQDFSTQGKDFRLSQFGSKVQLQNKVNQNKNTFLNAKSNADSLIKKQQANVQSINNTGLTNKTKLSGGLDFSVLTAKNGATLEDIRNYIKTRNIKKEVLENSNLVENIETSENSKIQKFQNGGSLIPSGALHKNKHNIESTNPELDGEITKKGIPVISYAEKGDILEYEEDGKTPKVLAEGGEIIQHAEIEKDEVILNLSLTKKLIELMKNNTLESEIEAGRILSIELIENTTDNSGITEKILNNEN